MMTATDRWLHWAAAVSITAMVMACGDPESESTTGTTTDSETASETVMTSDTGIPDTPTTGATTGASTGEPMQPACTPAVLPPLELVEGGEVIADAQIGTGGQCTWTLTLASPRVLEFWTDANASLVVDDRPEDEPGWQRPRVLAAGQHSITVENVGDNGQSVQLHMDDLGDEPPEIVRERSLVWTQPALTDLPGACGLACVMAEVAEDGHGGRLLRHWFDRFATTLHSERLGPRLLLDEFASQGMGPPETWDLDALPFIVTAVHSRLDLANTESCGELRVSLASTHPIFRPFHLIFLFAQPPLAADISPGGTLHCTATALRWARLSALTEDAFVAAAHALVAEHFVRANFVAAESLEFMISPWEWRQWFLVASDEPDLAQVLDNLPLFQTVDTPRLNQPGPLRDEFLVWVGSNAAALNARAVEIPAMFRPQSARANQGVPWDPLLLTPELDGEFPDLRRNLEIVGCPACHTSDADFVQTLPNRSFSPFYELELDARAEHLRAMARGEAAPAPFGPLQPAPKLPP